MTRGCSHGAAFGNDMQMQLPGPFITCRCARWECICAMFGPFALSHAFLLGILADQRSLMCHDRRIIFMWLRAASPFISLVKIFPSLIN